MKPGTYTQTCEYRNVNEAKIPFTHATNQPVYKGELVVGTISNVNVNQGSTVTSDISDTYDKVSGGDRSIAISI